MVRDFNEFQLMREFGFTPQEFEALPAKWVIKALAYLEVETEAMKTNESSSQPPKGATRGRIPQ